MATTSNAMGNAPVAAGDEEFTIRTNLFLSEFFDCIENLPNRLQLLLTELRNVDAQVKGNTGPRPR
jgi:hypothetical protein